MPAIPDGSIRHTTWLTADGVPEAEPRAGNTVEPRIVGNEVVVEVFSAKDGIITAKTHHLHIW